MRSIYILFPIMKRPSSRHLQYSDLCYFWQAFLNFYQLKTHLCLTQLDGLSTFDLTSPWMTFAKRLMPQGPGNGLVGKATYLAIT